MSKLCAFVIQNNISGVLDVINNASENEKPSPLDEVSTIGEKQVTALYLALHLNQTEIAIELLRAGASFVHSPDLPPPLVLALGHKNKEIITILSTLHPTTLTTPFRHYSSPLAQAAFMGEIELVKIFLHCGASTTTTNTNDNLFSPLRAAVQGECNPDTVGELIELLVAHGADINEQDQSGASLLLTSIMYDKHEALYHLLRLGADPSVARNDGVTPAVLAVHRASSSIASLETILTEKNELVNKESDCCGTTASLLHYAVLLGTSLPVRCLVAHGANINSVGMTGASTKLTPLATAIQQRDIEMVRLLLDLGADVDGRCFDGLLTPLTYLAYQFPHASNSTSDADSNAPSVDENHIKSFIAIAELLLQYGAQPNAKVEAVDQPQRSVKRTPLHFASEKASIPLIELLLKAGAEVNAFDANRMTPLSDAVKGCHEDVVALLLSHKATVTHRHIDGSNVFDYAKLAKNSTIQNLLDEAHEKSEI